MLGKTRCYKYIERGSQTRTTIHNPQTVYTSIEKKLSNYFQYRPDIFANVIVVELFRIECQEKNVPSTEPHSRRFEI